MDVLKDLLCTDWWIFGIGENSTEVRPGVRRNISSTLKKRPCENHEFLEISKALNGGHCKFKDAPVQPPVSMVGRIFNSKAE